MEEILRTCPGRRLKNVSLKMSSGRVLQDILRASPGRRLDDVLKKGHRVFHFRPIKDVFETKIKTFSRRLCDVFVSVGIKLCENSICKPLSIILDNCLNEDKFLHEWKIANIAPIRSRKQSLKKL